MTNSKTSTENNTKRVWIQWGEEQIVVDQFNSIDALKASGYVEKYASNFGYNHLIAREFSRMENGGAEYKNFFIVKADPKMNYGLDFKIYQLYTTDNGMNFLMQFNLGGSSITNAPLKRVNLNISTPASFLKIIRMDADEIKNLTEDQKDEYMVAYKLYDENIKNNIIESIQYSTNAFYKKDAQYRPELRKMCKKHNFIFA